MTKRMSIVLVVALSFMFLFSAVGYSGLTDSLGIKVSLEYEMPSGLFITNVDTDSTSNIDHQDVTYIEYTTTVDSIIDKKNDTTTTTSGRPGRPSKR